jgi:hypothetical protein
VPASPPTTCTRALTDPSARTRPREERLTSTTIVAEGELRRRLKRRVDLLGLTAVARELGVGREALARYGAEFDLHAGTRALIESRLSGLIDAPAVGAISRDLARRHAASNRKERGPCSS